MSKKILSLGLDLLGDDVQSDPIDSKRSWLEFDIVVLNWRTFFNRLNSQIASNGPMWFDESQLSTTKRQIESHNRSIHEFQEHKRLLVLIASSLPTEIRYLSRSAYIPWHLFGLIPGVLLNAEDKHGQRIAAARRLSKPISDFAAAISAHVRYSCTLSATDAIPILTIDGTEVPVALWVPQDEAPGVVYCPPPNPDRIAHQAFTSALCSLYDALTIPHNSELPALPAWHENYILPDEHRINDELIQLNAQVASLQNKVASAQSELAEVLILKRLITDQGDSLVQAATIGFRILGFSAEPGPIGRDDLILKSGDKIFVVEVKGRDNRDASEQDAAQLEKWVSGYHHEHGIEPKGILLVNGHRLTPLSERTEPVFPHQMLGYAQRKQQCLMAGYQLLSLALRVQANNLTQADAQEALFSAVGICPLDADIEDCVAQLHQTAAL